jgi:hypothetical protein
VLVITVLLDLAKVHDGILATDVFQTLARVPARKIHVVYCCLIFYAYLRIPKSESFQSEPQNVKKPSQATLSSWFCNCPNSHPLEVFEIDHASRSLEKGIITPLLLERVYGLTVSDVPLKAFTGMLHF